MLLQFSWSWSWLVFSSSACATVMNGLQRGALFTVKSFKKEKAAVCYCCDPITVSCCTLDLMKITVVLFQMSILQCDHVLDLN